MTNVSEQMYSIICKYCANCTEDKKCLEDVPWYCCSIYCKYFAEEKPPQKKRPLSIKRIMKITLVDTF